MEPDELRALLSQCPVRITMNNGQAYEVPHTEFATVGDYSVSLLIKDDEDQMVHRVVAIVNISDVQILSPGSASS